MGDSSNLQTLTSSILFSHLSETVIHLKNSGYSSLEIETIGGINHKGKSENYSDKAGSKVVAWKKPHIEKKRFKRNYLS